MSPDDPKQDSIEAFNYQSGAYRKPAHMDALNDITDFPCQAPKRIEDRISVRGLASSASEHNTSGLGIHGGR